MSAEVLQDKPHVHITDVHTFLSCRVRWDYSSPMRQRLEPLRPNKHLFLGSALHYALGAYYGSGPTVRDWRGLLPAYEAWVTEERQEIANQLDGEVPQDIDDYIELGRVMLDNYELFSRAHDDFEVVMPEVSLEREYSEFRYRGTADLLIRDAAGDYWLMEHKSYTVVPDFDSLAFSLQAAAYLLAASDGEVGRLFGPIRGVIFNVLRKSKPTLPKVLKGGGLERRANLNCTPELYLREVRRQGLDPVDYERFAETLNPYRLNVRLAISPDDLSMRQAEQELEWVVHDMLASPAIYRPETTRQCGYCAYRPLCELRLHGRDWRPLLWDYKTRGSDEGELDKAWEEG